MLRVWLWSSDLLGEGRNLIPLQLPLFKGESLSGDAPSMQKAGGALPLEKGEWSEGPRGIIWPQLTTAVSGPASRQHHLMLRVCGMTMSPQTFSHSNISVVTDFCPISL